MNELQSVSDQNFEISLNTLSSHMRNKMHFRSNPFEIIHKKEINDNLATKGFRQSYYTDCIFNGANLNETGYAGSVFIDTDFKDTQLNSCNMQSSDFRDCRFYYTKKQEITSLRFNKSIFTNCKFKNIIFYSANFCDCIFDHVTFENCKLVSVAFENALFREVTFSKLEFSSQNFDFAIFENIHFIDSALPFPAIPYIINGFKLLNETKDQILVTSFDNENNKMSRMTKEEYVALIPDFINYYLRTNGFFPLVNIYLAIKDYDQAFLALTKGIELSIRIRNFRMIKYYVSILKYSSNIDGKYKRDLYHDIILKINESDLDKVDLDNLNLYLSDIRQILMDDFMMPSININLKTKVDGNDYDKISVLLEMIDDIIDFHNFDSASSSVELRHNSPCDLFITINSQDVLTLISIAMTFYGIFAKSLKLLDSYYLTMIHQAEYHELKAKRKNKTETMQFINEKEKTVENNGIYVSEVNHNIINSNIKIENHFINGNSVNDDHDKING